MFFCYVLFSEKLNRFYIGATSVSSEERLEWHLKKVYSNKSFTAKADDWIVFLEIRTTTYEHARRLEKKIKSNKSSQYIRNLRKYPELIKKIYSETL